MVPLTMVLSQLMCRLTEKRNLWHNFPLALLHIPSHKSDISEIIEALNVMPKEVAQWRSGRVLDSRPRGRGFEPHRRHCVVSLTGVTALCL